LHILYLLINYRVPEFKNKAGSSPSHGTAWQSAAVLGPARPGRQSMLSRAAGSPTGLDTGAAATTNQ